MNMRLIALLALVLLLTPGWAPAHPGSGIAVDRQGNVYFIDTGSGIWKIDKAGKLTRIDVPAYHWMAIDPDNSLKNATLPNFGYGDAVVTRSAGTPAILASSDFPIAVGPDGSLYYPWAGGGDQLKIFRLSPSGSTTTVKEIPPTMENGQRRWLNGLDITSDGSIYYTELKAVRRLTPRGEITTVAAGFSLTGCDSVPEVGPELGPYLRGLDVDSDGTVYVAATGCRAVLKISSDKSVTTVLRSTAPWSPTAVAVSGKDLYVLEYFHTPGDNRVEWLPRVRKVASDGTVTTVATIDRK